MRIILTVLLVAKVFGQICRTISLEGGGSHGAYEAGAIWTMVNTLNAVDVEYDIISGISTGAINTGAMSQYAKGSEKAMADYLVNTWLTLGGNSSIYVQWPGGLAQGVLLEPGLYDTTPLRNFVNSRLTKPPQRKVTVGATNLNTGTFDNFDESVGSQFNLAVLSSGAPPFIFPFIPFQGTNYADGGCLINLDVFQAISRCYDINKSYANIIVDLIFDTKIDSIPASTSFNTLDVFARVSQINSYNSAIWYYHQAQLAYPAVKFRYVIVPSGSMPGGVVPLNFDQVILEQEVQMGKSDAANVIKTGENGKEILNELFQEMQSRMIIP